MIQKSESGHEQRRSGRRGFAAMDPQKQREIARAGGVAAHRKGRAHEFSPEEAREAGRKGGEAVSRNRDHMSRIGAKGGRASRGRRSPETPTRSEERSSGNGQSESGGSESQ